MTRSIFSRLILFVCGILTIAGASAAMRVKHWTPIDAFLEYRNTTPVIGSTIGTDATPGGAMAFNRTGFGAYHPDALAPGGFVTGTAHKLDAGRRTDMDFDDERLPGAAAAGVSGPSASLAGLWRLMGFAHAESHTGTGNSHTHVSSPKPTTHHPAAAAHPAPTLVGTVAQVTTPAILIGNNPTAVGGLIGGTTQLPSGSFATGGTKSPGGVGSFSATPEPASALLFGTGLLALSMVFRRRRT